MTTPRFQQEPSEGSRAVVERELARQSVREQPQPRDSRQKATRDDIEHLLGEVEADKIIQILALEPIFAELEQAVMRYAGADDVAGTTPRPLSGKAGQIYEVIAADEDDRAEQ